MLKVTGILLNVIGLAITLVGIINESRERRAPLLTAKQAAALHRLRQRLGWPRRDVTVTVGAATGRVEMWANAMVQVVRDPDAPIQDQLQAIEKNVDATVEGLKRQMKRDLELQSRRINSLTDDHTQLAGRVSESEQAERAITSRSMRWEVFGVTLALFGTTLSAFD